MSEEKVLKLREDVDLKNANTVKVTGYLKSVSIEEGKASTGKDYIRGTFQVLDAKGQTTTVDYYFNKITQSGAVSKLYTEAQKFRQYKSIVGLIESKEAANEEEAKAVCDIVQINGDINPNEYINDEKELVSRPKINGRFFHRLDKGKVNIDTFGAFFSVDVFFTSIKPELKNSVETGRVIIEAVVPTGISPARVGKMTFVVAKEEGAADYIIDNYFKNLTGSVHGEFVVSVAEAKPTKGFGAADKATSESVSFEWVILGGAPQQYDEDHKKSFDKAVIKEALAERLKYAEEQKEKSKNKTSNKTGGFGNAPTTAQVTQAQAQHAASKFDDEDF
mgnify:CR=1 FL=1